jgi:uncharacterized protein YlxP (DUF503 family)
MILGAALVELRIQGSRSLKDRRGVVQSIKRRVRNRFNLSVAEVGGQDTWQRAVIALAAAGSRAHIVRAELSKAVDFIEELHLAEVVGSEIEIVELPEEPAGLAWNDEDDGDGEDLA